MNSNALKNNPPRVRINGNRLVVRDPNLFDGDRDAGARLLLERVFSLPETRTAVVQADRGLITIVLNPVGAPANFWKRFGLLLRQSREVPGLRDIRADRLPLRALSSGLPVRVTRAGQTLTTFKSRELSAERTRIAHPLLRLRDVRRRLLDLLSSTHGVREVRAAGLWASVIVAYDPGLIDRERILRVLDDSWALLIQGPPIAPAPRKLVVAGGLLTLSFTAQFFRPALLPWATGAVALYSLPNFFAAMRDMRRGRVGLPAMYTVSLAFLLWTGLPFASSAIATLSQLWPALANALAARSERRLFAEHHRRLTSAWLNDVTGRGTEVDLLDVRPGAIIRVLKGDYVPVDGTIVEGLATIDEHVLTGARGAVDRAVGDRVYAGSLVTGGTIAVKAARVGSATSGAAISRALPKGTLSTLPSSVEAERVANRNAKPALLAAGLLLLATRTLRLSQVAIRPDYATAPRLSTHLSALTAVAESLSGGALVRNPAALDRLFAADVIVFDDGAYFTRRAIRVSDVQSKDRAGAQEAVSLAFAALAHSDDPRAEALRLEAQRLGIPEVLAHDRHRIAGATIFRDEAGSLVSLATPAFALHQHIRSRSSSITDLLRAEAKLSYQDPEARTLVVARGQDIQGIIRFDRRGPRVVAQAMSALRAEIPEVRFIHLSSASQDEAEERASGIDLDAVFGGLAPLAKTDALRSLGSGTIWIGDGTDSSSLTTRSAATVSVSVAGIGALPQDLADIVLLRGDLNSLINVRHAAQGRLNRLRTDYRVVYFANVAAVAGGFTAGFGSLQAGLASNLGTAAVFLSRWQALRGLATRTEQIARARRVAAFQNLPDSVFDGSDSLFPVAPLAVRNRRGAR
jgi:cation transport ATPase